MSVKITERTRQYRVVKNVLRRIINNAEVLLNEVEAAERGGLEAPFDDALTVERAEGIAIDAQHLWKILVKKAIWAFYGDLDDC